MPAFQIHLIYVADGMRRPLSSRQRVPAETVRDAVNLAENFISSAYESGYTTLSWTAENLDALPGLGTESSVSGEAEKVTLEVLERAKMVRRRLNLPKGN